MSGIPAKGLMPSRVSPFACLLSALSDSSPLFVSDKDLFSVADNLWSALVAVMVELRCLSLTSEEIGPRARSENNVDSF
mgnify:CR=1 FL=1|jgi:hypothetical protein